MGLLTLSPCTNINFRRSNIYINETGATNEIFQMISAEEMVVKCLGLYIIESTISGPIPAGIEPPSRCVRGNTSIIATKKTEFTELNPAIPWFENAINLLYIRSPLPLLDSGDNKSCTISKINDKASPWMNEIMTTVIKVESVIQIMYKEFTIPWYKSWLNWRKIDSSNDGVRIFKWYLIRPGPWSRANVENMRRSRRDWCDNIASNRRFKHPVQIIQAVDFEVVIGKRIGTRFYTVKSGFISR